MMENIVIGILYISVFGALPLAYYLFRRIRPARLALGKWKALLILLILGPAIPYLLKFSSFLGLRFSILSTAVVLFGLLSLLTLFLSIALSRSWRGSVLVVYPAFWLLHLWGAWGILALIFGIMGGS